MFKYTPPWQVLCATLEPRAQVRLGSLLVIPAPPCPRGGSGGWGGWAPGCWEERDAAAVLAGTRRGRCGSLGSCLSQGDSAGVTDPWGPPLCSRGSLPTSSRGGGPTELGLVGVPQSWAQGGQRWCWDPRVHSGQRGPGSARSQSCPVPAPGCAHIRARCRVWCSPVLRGRWRGLCLSPRVKQAPRSLPETHSHRWPHQSHHPCAQQVPAALPQEPQSGTGRPQAGQG